MSLHENSTLTQNVIYMSVLLHFDVGRTFWIGRDHKRNCVKIK